jgi:uncharacterized membrane protein
MKEVIEKKVVTKRFQAMALFGYVGLLILMPLWLFYLEPRSQYSATFTFCLYVLPLLFPLKGIIQDKPYTYAWANFIVLIYFLHGFTLLWIAGDEMLYVVLELLFATSMFVGCTYYARHRGQELGLKVPKLKQDLADEKAAFEYHEQNKE